MRTIGMLTTIAVAVIAAGIIIVAVISIPDIKRYLRIRQM